MTLPVTTFPIQTQPLPNFVSADTAQALTPTQQQQVKNNIGIGAVQNTADMDKPMSTATKVYVDTSLGPVATTASTALTTAQAAAAVAAAAGTVKSVNPGTNVTIGGTAVNPIVNVALPSDAMQDTRDSIANFSYAASVKSIFVNGRSSVTDRGGGRYVRVAAAPSHSARIRSLDRFMPDGTTDPTNGGWWSVDMTGTIINFAWFNTNGTPAGNTAALQEAANQYTGSFSNGYKIYIPAGGWSFLGGVTFGKNNQMLVGDGNGVTVNIYTPSANGETFLKWAQPGVAQGPIYCGISDMTLVRSGTNPSYQSTAIQHCNTSIFPIKRVYVAAWTDTGGNSIGHFHMGREFTTGEDFVVQANQPIYVGVNPDRAIVADIDCDYLAFHRCHFIKVDGTGALATTGAPIYFDDGVNVTNFSMRDYDLIGGFNGLRWETTVDNYAKAQTLGGAGNLTLNGNRAPGGVGTSTVARRVFIGSAGNNSGVNFTITGTLNGTAQSETVAGPNGGLVPSTKLYSTVASIYASAATTGSVYAGPTAEGTGGNFGFSVQDGRREQAASGGVQFFLNRPNAKPFTNVRLCNVLDQYGVISTYGNWNNVSLELLFQSGSTTPTFNTDANVNGISWKNISYYPGSANGLTGQTMIMGVDQRANEPLPRTGWATSTAITGATVLQLNLPTTNPGGTNRVWRNGNVLNIT